MNLATHATKGTLPGQHPTSFGYVRRPDGDEARREKVTVSFTKAERASLRRLANKSGLGEAGYLYDLVKKVLTPT